MFSEIFINCLFDYLCHINNAHFDWPNTLTLYLLNIVTYYFNSLYKSVVLNSIFLSLNQNICCGYSKNRLNEMVLLSTKNI